MYNKSFCIGGKDNTAIYLNLNSVIILSSNKINLEDLKDIEISIFSNTTPNISQFGSLNNEYKRLIDFVMMLPADKLKIVRDAVLENENQ